MATDLQGLLSSPALMMGMGLLSENGRAEGALRGLLMAQGSKYMTAKQKAEEEDRKQRGQLLEMQIKAAQEAQARDELTRGTMASMSTLSPENLAMYQDNPQFQANYRAAMAANGNPQLAELGGVLQPQAEPMKPTSSMINFMASGGDLGTTEGQAAFRKLVEAKAGAETRPRMIEQGGVQYWADGPNAGKPVLGAISSTVDPKLFDREKTLRTEISAQSKSFNDIQDAFGRISATAKDPSAAGDLALIFNYMKMLDPGSTVREGEFANAQNAAGVSDRVRAYWNNLQRGERLTPEQRVDFMKQAGSLYADSAASYNSTRDYYADLAKQYQADPGRILPPPQRYDPKAMNTIISDAEQYLKDNQREGQ